MSGKRVSDMTGAAPGVVKARLSGAAGDIAAVAEVLAREFGVIERSASYPNRRDPGERVYLTVRIGDER